MLVYGIDTSPSDVVGSEFGVMFTTFKVSDVLNIISFRGQFGVSDFTYTKVR